MVTASADGYAPGARRGAAPGRFEILLTPASSLAGTVVDAAGDQPVAGARVVLRSVMEAGLSEAATAFSDAEGKFRLEPLAPGRVVATAATEHGFGRSDGSTLVGLGQHVDGMVIRVFPAHRITGQVVIAGDRKPCPAARVTLRDRLHDRWSTLHSGSDGQQVADGVAAGTYQVSVSCERYQARDHYEPIVVGDSDLTGLTWEVDSGARIHSKLVTRSGEPVAAAQLWTQSAGTAAPGRAATAFDTTRLDGSYELDGLPPGTYRITVLTDRGVPPRDGYTAEVAAGASVERDLVLDGVDRVVGTVVDDTGKPVTDITVLATAVTRSWAYSSHRATTDADGGFTIDGLAPGDYRIIAMRGETTLRKPGTTNDNPQPERATVRAGQAATVRIVVDGRTGAITGSVIDAAGQPVSDAFVASSRESQAAGARSSSVTSTRDDWWGTDRPVLTSPDGSFTLGGLAPGTYTLRAHRKGGGEAIAEHVAIGATVRLTIKPTGSIAGVARRDRGGPPQDLEVSVHDLQTGFERQDRFYATQGRFALSDLPAGHFELAVRGDGSHKSITVDLADGEARTGLDITLDPLVAVTGRIVEYGTQKPIPGIRVFASPATGSNLMAFNLGDDATNISDAAGRFTVTDVAAGKVALRCLPMDLQTTEYSVFLTVRSVAGTGTVDVGDIGLLKQRVKTGEPVGVLGLRFATPPAGTPLDQQEYQISWIDPSGAAAHSELQVGDLITSVDGVDITGSNAGLWRTLVAAAPGTRIALGTRRGVTAGIVLGAP